MIYVEIIVLQVAIIVAVSGGLAGAGFYFYKRKIWPAVVAGGVLLFNLIYLGLVTADVLAAQAFVPVSPVVYGGSALIAAAFGTKAAYDLGLEEISPWFRESLLGVGILVAAVFAAFFLIVAPLTGLDGWLYTWQPPIDHSSLEVRPGVWVDPIWRRQDIANLGWYYVATATCATISVVLVILFGWRGFMASVVIFAFLVLIFSIAYAINILGLLRRGLEGVMGLEFDPNWLSWDSLGIDWDEIWENIGWKDLGFPKPSEFFPSAEDIWSPEVPEPYQIEFEPPPWLPV